MADKTIVGLTEDIIVYSNGDKRTIHARIDTGATVGSIDSKLAAELKLGPIERVKKVKSANGVILRPAIRVRINLAGKELVGTFTLADRSHMKYQALIGQDILKEGFLIDPQKGTNEEEDEDGQERD